MRIALATCRKLPEPDPDERPLLSELRALGAEAELLAWDDPKADASRFDLCVVRSTWNYIHDLPGFLSWTRRTATQTRLLNGPEIVRWNSDKGYLARLPVPAVPTLFFKSGSRERLKDKIAGWKEIVIKPRVGASSFKTKRFAIARLAAAEDFLRSAGRDMMIQPYLRSVETSGERAIVWLGGAVSHAVRKSPRLHGDEESVKAVHVGDDERRFAQAAIKPWRDELLYARVDAARAEDGSLLLMELELIEPSLFLVQHPSALRRFARACVAAARRIS